MRGREEAGEIRKRSRHMWSVPSSKTVVVTPLVDSNGSSTTKHFVKDGRKISVGDCALFKPSQESSPYIGIIRSVTSDKESNLGLRVNWLYRPAEVKLGKGVALEAAPNEVFYSFHSDEIPAASLLHPCKVAFLPKGVELPPGVSSFVCRRVYDITNECLWWLTDPDYIDDNQEEVNQLLQKTHKDMHATTQHQQGAPSPKSINGTASMSPLKSSPDSMQNSSSNPSSQTKGKKRERGVLSSEPNKWERSLRADGGGSGQFKSESMLKLEIAKLTEKGGLVDSEAVGRLVQLMQPEKSEKKIDLSGRCLLAGIIAATDKLDCLSQFVQLRGLPVLDEWLQEVHKGKIGDPGNMKDGDKSVEDFLFVLLRALDKLPVNLNALQMCNIGKSVNHLRSHKNSEIQKKARSLVDTWKKRVEAEISIKDSKSGASQAVPWPGRSRHDSSHGGNRHSNGSSDAAIRSSVTHHSSLKSAPVKLVQGDSNLKPAYQGGARPAIAPNLTAVNNKDAQSRVVTNGASSEPPQAVLKEGKSSSSSHSHNNSQCSSDHAKNIVPSGKEDAKSSTAASRILNKLTGCGSKHRKSVNGLQSAATSALQREGVPSRGISSPRISATEKVSNANAIDTSIHEGNNHKLIVKIPNRSRGPAQSVAGGGSMEEFSCGSSRTSSPALSERHDQSDASLRGKLDARQSNEVDGSSTAVQQRAAAETRDLPTVTKVPYFSSRNEMKSRTFDSAFSSMNALVESCVKFSESNVPISAGDNAGMNLLASVAAGEISISGTCSPATSACKDSAAAENLGTSYTEERKQVPGDDQQRQSTSTPDTDKQHVTDVSKADDVETSKEDLHQNEDCLKGRGKLDEPVGVASPISTSGKVVADGCPETLAEKSSAVADKSHNNLPVASQSSCSTSVDKVKDESLTELLEKETMKDSVLCPSSNMDDETKLILPVASKSEATHANEKPLLVASSAGQDLVAENSCEVKSEKVDSLNAGEHAGLEGDRRLDHGNKLPLTKKENKPSVISQKQEDCTAPTTDKGQGCTDYNADGEEVCMHQGSKSIIQGIDTQIASEGEVSLSTKESNLTAVGNETKDDSKFARGSETGTKHGFDLNEGLSVDDGRSGEPVYFCSISPMQIAVTTSSCGPSASITVASAAKGPFVPPEDLLRNKHELGWKGSAATSAFRPAEPRKVMMAPVGSSKGSLPDVPACKRTRPPLDFDLNVADERILLDSGDQGSTHELITATSFRCSGGLDLDLNKVDEASNVGYSAPSDKGASSSSIYVNGEISGRRDFDLNNGPAIEEIHVEQASYNQYSHSNMAFQPSFGARMNGSAAGNGFAWYPPGTSYSVSMLPEKESFPVVGIGNGPQRVIGAPTSSLSFNHDDYKGSVLSSTPAMPFYSTPFQYPVFPFGANFPLPTSALSGGGPSGYMDPAATAGRMPAIPSQSIGTTSSVPFQYSHPFLVSRTIPNNSIAENAQKWGKQSLDLNSGPGSAGVEGRDESVPRQVAAMGSQSVAEEQGRAYNMAGGVLKRKEPEGGWNMDKLNFKQSSWR